MEGTTNLYAENNGHKTFSGVIQTDNKSLVMVYDQWNHNDIVTDVPVGINLRLIRAMEGFLDLPMTHVKVRRAK